MYYRTIAIYLKYLRTNSDDIFQKHSHDMA